MANDLSTAFNASYWAPEMQKVYIKENVARQSIANESLAAALVDGTRVHRPYRSALKVQDYVKGTAISSWTDLSGEDEYLDINTTKLIAFYVKHLRPWLVTTIENLAVCWNIPRAENCKV